MFHFNGLSFLIDTCHTTKWFHFRRRNLCVGLFFPFASFFFCFFLCRIVNFRSHSKHLNTELHSFQVGRNNAHTYFFFASYFYISLNEEIFFRLCDGYLFCKRFTVVEGDKIPSSSSSSSS